MITYLDTSVLLKLLLSDEPGVQVVHRIWLESTYVTCGEVAYAEARAGLAAANRSTRLTSDGLSVAKEELEVLWSQVRVVEIGDSLVRTAGDLAETEALRGYDAVHLACALAAQATVFATADEHLLEAAQRRGLGVSNPHSD